MAEPCKGSTGHKTHGSRQNVAALQVNKTVPGKYWRVIIWRCGKSTEKTARAVKQTQSQTSSQTISLQAFNSQAVGLL